MHFDELEWVRDIVDRWLSENVPWLLLTAAIIAAVAMLPTG